MLSNSLKWSFILHFSTWEKQWMEMEALPSSSNHNLPTPTLAGMAQLVGASSYNWKVAGSIPGQGTCLGWGFDPWSGHIWSLVWVHTIPDPGAYDPTHERQPINVSLSLPPSLWKQWKKCSHVRIRTTKNHPPTYTPIKIRYNHPLNPQTPSAKALAFPCQVY